MSDIELLQSRILAAMDRIGQSVEAIATAPAKVDESALEAMTAERDAAHSDLDAIRAELDGVKAELEEEKVVSAQFEERIKKLKTGHAAELEEARSAAVPAGVDLDKIADIDIELQRLRKANEQLRSSNAALREANEAGVGEPHLINSAMLAELEGLRAARAADVAEATAIMDQLVPLLDTARGAADEEEV